jgi:NAD(P)-dependent dehydrogenase (short-subunit alcohol dehydrogenase family)
MLPRAERRAGSIIVAAQQPRDFEGKIILVAGAGSGMGRATALALAAAGAQVVLASRRAEALSELHDEIQRAGGSSLPVPTDAADRAAVDTLLDTALSIDGRIDAVINSAGANIPGRAIDELTDESWSGLLANNLTAAFHLTQAIVPVFRRQGGGVLVHISSSSALRGDRSGIAYQATKAGVAALARGAMEEERENGIRVTVIYPGLTDTPLLLNRPVVPAPEMLKKALQPEDVADACLFVLRLPARAYVPELVLYPSRT